MKQIVLLIFVTLFSPSAFSQIGTSVYSCLGDKDFSFYFEIQNRPENPLVLDRYNFNGKLKGSSRFSEIEGQVSLARSGFLNFLGWSTTGSYELKFELRDLNRPEKVYSFNSGPKEPLEKLVFMQPYFNV